MEEPEGIGRGGRDEMSDATLSVEVCHICQAWDAVYVHI